MKKERSRRPIIIIAIISIILMMVIALTAVGVFAFRTAGERTGALLDRLSDTVVERPAQDGVVAEERAQGGSIYDEGVLVRQVDPEGPAAEAGIRRGTIILSVAGQEIESAEDLVQVLQEQGGGAVVTVTVINGPEPEDLTVQLAEAPPYLGVNLVGAAVGRLQDNLQMPENLDELRELNPEEFHFDMEQLAQGVVIAEVVEESAAAEAGIQAGDVVQSINGEEVSSVEQFTELIGAQAPGDELTVVVLRGEETQELTVTLGENPEDETRAFLGVRVAPQFEFDRGDAPGRFHFDFGEEAAQAGAAVVNVSPESPAAEAGLEPGDVITAVNGAETAGVDAVVEAIGEQAPGEEVALSVTRDGETVELTVTLGENPEVEGRGYLGVELGGFFGFEGMPFGDLEQFLPEGMNPEDLGPGSFFHMDPDGEGFQFELPEGHPELPPEFFEQPSGTEELNA